MSTGDAYNNSGFNPKKPDHPDIELRKFPWSEFSWSGRVKYDLINDENPLDLNFKCPPAH